MSRLQMDDALCRSRARTQTRGRRFPDLSVPPLRADHDREAVRPALGPRPKAPLEGKIEDDRLKLAPQDGFEPPTGRLTAACSTAELPGNVPRLTRQTYGRFNGAAP